MWPFSKPSGRRHRIEVTHRLRGLEPIADALRELAAAQRYAAKMGRPDITPVKRKEDAGSVPSEWLSWEQSAAAAFVPQVEKETLYEDYRILAGLDRVTPERKQRAMGRYGEALDTYDLPRLDGRDMLARQMGGEA